MDGVREILDGVWRNDSAGMLGVLARRLDDFDRAEEALQDAIAEALRRWPAEGVPGNPPGWLVRTAWRKALDRLRREANGRAKHAALAAELATAPATGPGSDPAADPASGTFPGSPPGPPTGDDRLAMIFACCHPSLPESSRVALTLHAVAGLPAESVAAAFLLPRATAAQRLVRAKRHLRHHRVRVEVPPPGELPARLPSVLRVIYLLYNDGYLTTRASPAEPSAAEPSAPKPTAPKPSAPKPSAPKPSAPKPSAPKPSAAESRAAEPTARKPSAAESPAPAGDMPGRNGPDRRELAREALGLARRLTSLMPAEPEVAGLAALLELSESRTASRFDRAGRLVLLEDQDRSLWDTNLIASACRRLARAATHDRPGPYQLEATIAAQHALAPAYERTDWGTVRRLYDLLATTRPTPVVLLGRAVATSFVHGPAAALVEVDALAGRLDGYRLWHATRAGLLHRLNRPAEAATATRRALALATDPAERDLLTRRLESLTRETGPR
ncbi:DUF6596 domain-containing protein [Actinoplanes sp. DH11]|uniref:RNA polymerase sigma factor n=1 Tax=Actinoplanes sp. DH11 TaxID=2857011 RepID=UPI0027E209E1|nr:DUF6596 domain-containing protein [Actinoplanes sp. DH11]